MTVPTLANSDERQCDPHTGALTEHQFRALAGGMSSVLWRSTPDGQRFVSPRWAQLTGTSEASLQQSGWLSAIAPTNRPAVATLWRSALLHGTQFQAEFRLRLADRSERWFRSRGEPVRDATGQITAWLGVAIDIHAEKEATAALIRNEERLRMVMDAAHVGTLEHDLVAGTIECDDVARAALGVSAEGEQTFGRFLEAVHPDDRGHFLRGIDVARRMGSDGPVQFSFRAKHADGQVVWTSLRGSYLFEGHGSTRRAARFVGVAGDITEHVRELEERARLGAIVNSSEVSIVATTTDGRVTHWNTAAECLFGYAAFEMVGRSFLTVVPPELIAEELADLASVRDGTPIVAKRTDRITKDGRRITIAHTMSPIRDDMGNCIGISKMARDITREIALQAELAQAQKMDAIGKLAGGVAHDLNNMLTTMLLGIDCAVAAPSLDAEARVALVSIREEGFRAATLIRQLLAVARRQVVSPRPCNIGEIVSEIAPMIGRMLGEDITLSTVLDAAAGVMVDPRQIHEALLNLAVNARDAMPQGGHLMIATADDPVTESVILTVTDTGCGMSADVCARVFEPFFTTKPEGKGSGLGLSTTYGIVAQAQGTIAVASDPGAGASFTISLPAIEAPPPLRLARAAAISGPSGGDETILIVEDDRLLRDQLVRGLSKLGYRILEARHGVDALAISEHFDGRIDAVVSDAVMPEMGGAELVPLLKLRRPLLEVLFISGYSEQAVRARGLLVPGVAILSKPFELATLAAAIRELLDHPRGAVQISA